MMRLGSGFAPIAALALSATILSACGTPTPYQPIDSTRSAQSARGYSEVRIEPNRYRLKFSGNTLTSRETVENYMLYRAAELTLQNGYDWFSLASRNVREDRTVSGGGRDPFGPYYGSGFFWRYHYGSWSPWGAWQEPSTVFYRYEASAEVTFGRGPKPASDLNAYDARDVRQGLEPHIIRPQPKP